MKLTLFFLLICSSAVFGQLVQLGVLDDFLFGQALDESRIEIELTDNLSDSEQNIIVEESFNADNDCDQFNSDYAGSGIYALGFSLIGCARDMQVNVNAGIARTDFESDIFPFEPDYDYYVNYNYGEYDFAFPGEWAIANPSQGDSVMTLQYDGKDGSFDLDLNGLNNFDITLGGLATSLRLLIITDKATNFDIVFYSPDGSTCQATVPLQRTISGYTNADIRYDVPYSSFSGNCNMANVGAAEVSFASRDALDARVRRISFFGVNPSESQTPTPGPSDSRTPTPGPSNSNTPTRPPTNSQTPAPSPSQTPSRSVECTIECNCPAFSCHLQYNFDDDDFLFYY